MQLRFVSLSLIAIFTAGATGCADDPVGYSAPVGINLKAKSDDVVQGALDDEKGITTESGNPYGAFVNDAKIALGGTDPGSIDVSGVDLRLGADSRGVVTLGEVFAGEAAVLFQMNDTNNTYPVAVGWVDAETGGGPIGLDVGFDSGAVAAEDLEKLIGGSFKVIVRGPATASFSEKGAEADLQVTLTFAAYE